jgi:WD40 repeat protein
MALSPDGKVLATGDANLIRFWDLASGRELRQLQAPLDEVEGLAFSPDGKILASGHLGRTALLWDLGVGTNFARIEAKHNRLTHLQFTPDGKTLLTGDTLDRTVRLFDVASRTLQHQVTRSDFVQGCALAPDGSLLALGAQKGSASIWDVRTGQLVRELGGMAFVGGVGVFAGRPYLGFR